MKLDNSMLSQDGLIARTQGRILTSLRAGAEYEENGGGWVIADPARVAGELKRKLERYLTPAQRDATIGLIAAIESAKNAA